MDSLTRFRAVALTVPFALALWVLMFAAAGFGNAPLLVVSSIGWLTFLVAPALHFLYAAVADIVRAGLVPIHYLIALAVAHYAAIAYVGLATEDGRDAFLESSPGAWRAGGVWVVLGIALFVAWQVALARAVRPRPPMVS